MFAPRMTAALALGALALMAPSFRAQDANSDRILEGVDEQLHTRRGQADPLTLLLEDPGETEAKAERGGTLGLPEAILLGVVEGLTEYLPVSSTGHLHVTQKILGIGDQPDEKRAADAYAICIQAGAILAVLGLYRQRFRQILRGLRGKDPQGLRLLGNLAAGFAPAAVIGLLLSSRIKACLFGVWPIVVGWFAGGIVILLWTRRGTSIPTGNRTEIDQLHWRQALLIGLAQCLAMWPGVSRSLATILGGLFAGLPLGAAVEFSFLLGAVTLGAATAYEGLGEGAAIVQAYGWLSTVVGLVAAFVSAVIAVRWMIGYLKRRGLGPFGWYRVALAIIVGACHAAGLL